MNKILKKAVAISAAICSLALPVNALPGSAEDNIKFSDVKENFENITVYGWNNPVLYESMSKVLTHPNFTLNISRYNNKVYYYNLRVKPCVLPQIFTAAFGNAAV